MHCPRCGNNTESDRKFCRSCGFNLEGVAQLLLAQEDGAIWQTRQIEKGLNFFLGSVVMASVIVLFGVVAHHIITRLDRLSGTFLLFLIAFVLAVIFMAYSAIRSRRAKDEGNEGLGMLPQPGATVELLPEPKQEAITSVAERTTELLEVEKRRKDKER